MRIFETKVVLSINLPVYFEKNNLLRRVMSGKKVPKYEQRAYLCDLRQNLERKKIANCTHSNFLPIKKLVLQAFMEPN